MEERAAICIGCQILKYNRKILPTKSRIKRTDRLLFGLQPEEGMDAVVFSRR